MKILYTLKHYHKRTGKRIALFFFFSFLFLPSYFSHGKCAQKKIWKKFTLAYWWMIMVKESTVEHLLCFFLSFLLLLFTFIVTCRLSVASESSDQIKDRIRTIRKITSLQTSIMHTLHHVPLVMSAWALFSPLFFSSPSSSSSSFFLLSILPRHHLTKFNRFPWTHA